MDRQSYPARGLLLAHAIQRAAGRTRAVILTYKWSRGELNPSPDVVGEPLLRVCPQIYCRSSGRPVAVSLEHPARGIFSCTRPKASRVHQPNVFSHAAIGRCSVTAWPLSGRESEAALSSYCFVRRFTRPTYTSTRGENAFPTRSIPDRPPVIKEQPTIRTRPHHRS